VHDLRRGQVLPRCRQRLHRLPCRHLLTERGIGCLHELRRRQLLRHHIRHGFIHLPRMLHWSLLAERRGDLLELHARHLSVQRLVDHLRELHRRLLHGD
jgi:hypothetical protein